MLEQPQLTPFGTKEQQLYSVLNPDVQTPLPIAEAQPSHPMEGLFESTLPKLPKAPGYR